MKLTSKQTDWTNETLSFHTVLWQSHNTTFHFSGETVSQNEKEALDFESTLQSKQKNVFVLFVLLYLDAVFLMCTDCPNSGFWSWTRVLLTPMRTVAKIFRAFIQIWNNRIWLREYG